ncbi:IE-0 [Spodoptera littoralis nucleopolyhedrovirus]|uniref:IE-0 n=1 Tax=Spodoptera littoralis nuclear polyhedrosis virus TaxID=10456 RepID=M1JSC2_NPVSL|nr:IE-0 [Spodoptera littoralis nucleopolyhedrovirus]AGE89862.1 IE-0 [Spodoptera littoralis nucleopolyhedrovirus]AYU75200.1 immediate early 0 protein [Spodoptera littoralis nucleopolyhedrovirus]
MILQHPSDNELNKPLSQVFKHLREMGDVYDDTEMAAIYAAATTSVEDTKNDVSSYHDHQVLSNFILNGMYSEDLKVNLKAQYNVKLAAFRIIEHKYGELKDICGIDKTSPLHYGEDETVVLCGEDKCYHSLIAEIADLSKIIEDLYDASPVYRLNYFIFVPYVKRLLQIICMFTNDVCCKRSVRSTIARLETCLKRGNEKLESVRRLNKTLCVMSVFLQQTVYECNICKDVSHDERFLKPDECCGFRICNLCYANLWKFSNTPHNPVCPVCKTSYRVEKYESSSSLINVNI